MSTHDEGFGQGASPNSGSQSDFAHRDFGAAPGAETWGNNALNAQKSEVNLMAHGAGRPGQPAGGQRPMFGGGSPVFAQMPVYTPVTRGQDIAPQTPEPPQQPYAPYSQPQPHQQTGVTYPGHAQPPLNYPSPHTGTTQSFQTSQPAPAQNYQSPQGSASANYLNVQMPQAPSRQTDFHPDAYRQSAQQPQPQNFPSAQPGAQNFSAPSYGGSQGFTGQPYQERSFGQASFSEPASLDASFPETSFDQNFAATNFADQNFGKQSFGDASFPEPSSLDASFPDTSFPAAPSFNHQEQSASDSMNAYARSQADHGAFDTFAEEPAQDYSLASGEVPPSDPRRQLQAFDALYDQPPQIALGSPEPSRRAQDFFESERVDADFLDEGQVLPPPNAGKKPFKGRSIFMVGSALLGAIALGGALAFAYKQSGGGLSGELPLVTADNRPVKELPQDPGGKEFPHKNKLIYDRLTNGDEPESVQLTPRQENVAIPTMPPSLEAAGMPAPVASTDLGAPPTTQAMNGEAVAAASGEDTMPDGGPRKVKTMVVRPDGSVMESEQPAQTAAAPAAAQEAQPQMMPVAVPVPAPDSAPQETASVQTPPAPEPKPAAQPAPQQTAALAPQPAAAPTKYVVQVASKKNQTEALASFADMQQKYPSLLASYRPIVQKADLGDKGVWYRLRIGPIADKSSASKLCSQLKQQGLPDCLVMAAQ